MTRCLTILLAVAMAATAPSCSRSRSIPGDVLGKEEMGRVLFDIGMAEGHVEVYLYRDSAKSRDSLLRTELDRVLAIHGVGQEQFLRSYRFYKSRPSLFKEVVDTLQARTQRDQQKMYAPRQKRPVRDSSSKSP
jgi:hypothetical protein